MNADATPEQQPWWWKHPGAAGDAVFASTAMRPAHKLVVWAVMRGTIGHFNKSEAAIGHAVIQSMTGLSARHVSRLMQDLTDEGVLVVIHPATFASAAVLTFNADPSAWGRFSVGGAIVAPGADSAPGDTMSPPPSDTMSAPPRQDVTTPPDTMSPIEESSRFSEETLKNLTGANASAPSIQEGSHSAGEIVAHAATFAKDHDLALTATRRARLGKQAKELLDAGADLDHLLVATEIMLIENKPPTALEYILGDIQKGGRTDGRAGVVDEHAYGF